MGMENETTPGLEMLRLTHRAAFTSLEAYAADDAICAKDLAGLLSAKNLEDAISARECLKHYLANSCAIERLHDSLCLMA